MQYLFCFASKYTFANPVPLEATSTGRVALGKQIFIVNLRFYHQLLWNLPFSNDEEFSARRKAPHATEFCRISSLQNEIYSTTL